MSLASKIQIVPTLKTVEQPSLIDAERYILVKEDNWTLEYISDNYSEDEERREGVLYLPPGQRNWAWKNKVGNKKMVNLIDSLIHNYPVPSSIVNLVSGRYQIYDGRHRMETIWRFRNNKFTWKGLYYKDLCENDRYKFDTRRIPVTITYSKKGQSVSIDQLAEIFIRLNSGQQLTDSDMFWAYRDTPVMKGVRTLILENIRLKAVFGDIDMIYRPDLANWVAYYRGLGTNNAGNATTSYHRASENDGLQNKLDEGNVRSGIDALCSLYERANIGFPSSSKELRSYKKIGFVNAFFLADWMATDAAAKADIVTKWLDIIGRLRSNPDTQKKMRSALHTNGAQNLTSKKIASVLEQVNKYLLEDKVDDVDGSDDDSV